MENATLFSTLHQTDRVNFRLASKSWRRRSHAESTFGNEVFFLHNYPLQFRNFRSPNFSKSFQPSHISLYVDQFNLPVFDFANTFWEHYGGRLKTLNVFISKYNYGHVLNILARCPILEHLALRTDTDGSLSETLAEAFYDGVQLNNLLTLSVEGDGHIIFPLIRRLLKTAPMLKKIKFICGKYCKHKLFTIPKNIVLEELSCACPLVDDEFIDTATNNVGNGLQILSLSRIRNLSDMSLTKIKKRCKNLNQLEIGKCDFDAEELSEVVIDLRLLTVISFFQSDSLNDDIIAALYPLRELKRLKIASCKNITNAGISHLFRDENCNLVELGLIELGITDQLIKKIAPNLPNLKMLNLSFCPKITSASLESVATHNQVLQCLIFYNNKAPDSLDLVPYINRMHNLVHLVALDRSCITDSDIPDNNLKLPNLKVLDNPKDPFIQSNFEERENDDPFGVEDEFNVESPLLEEDPVNVEDQLNEESPLVVGDQLNVKDSCNVDDSMDSDHSSSISDYLESDDDTRFEDFMDDDDISYDDNEISEDEMREVEDNRNAVDSVHAHSVRTAEHPVNVEDVRIVEEPVNVEDVRIVQDPVNVEDVRIVQDPANVEDVVRIVEDPVIAENVVRIVKDPVNVEDVRIVQDPANVEDVVRIVGDLVNVEEVVRIVEDPVNVEDVRIVQDPANVEYVVRIVEDPVNIEDVVRIVEEPANVEDVRILEDPFNVEDVRIVKDPANVEDIVRIVEDPVNIEDVVRIVEQPVNVEDVRIVQDPANVEDVRIVEDPVNVEDVRIVQDPANVEDVVSIVEDPVNVKDVRTAEDPANVEDVRIVEHPVNVEDVRIVQDPANVEDVVRIVEDPANVDDVRIVEDPVNVEDVRIVQDPTNVDDVVRIVGDPVNVEDDRIVEDPVNADDVRNIDPIGIADFRARCPAIKYIDHFCCDTMTYLHIAGLVILWRKHILECHKSPLGPCYFRDGCHVNDLNIN